MGTHTPRWQRLLSFALILLIASGCYQAAGGASQPTPVSQALPTATPPPTETPFPTDIPTEAPTVDPATLGQGGAETLLETPTDFPLIAQQPTLDPFDPLGATATTNALLQSEPLFVTATAIVLGATQTVEAILTGTQAVFAPPTFTPPPLQPQPGATQAPLLPGADCIHEVRVEDRNLYRISLRYGVKVEDIARVSGITNINLISVGQRLTIPGCGTTGVTPLPTSTEPASATPLGASVAPGATLVPAQRPASGQVHVVRQGETLYEISVQYGVPVADIAAANGISNINVIFLGQELIIP